MTSLKKYIQEYESAKSQYILKRNKLDQWIKEFHQLEEDINQLNTLFEQHYEDSAISEEFPDEIKEKLENRRDGIRLSAKSVGKLPRKLNMEKPLEEKRVEVLLEGEQEEKIQQILSGTIFENIGGETVHEETKMDEQIETTQLDTQEVGVTVEGENEVNVNSDDESLLEVQKDKGVNSDLEIFLQSFSNKYEEANEQLAQLVEEAEKRFLKFMEKSVAPIMDGLVSGHYYGKELLEELEVAGQENLEKVKEWLTIYSSLLKPIQKLFDDYGIKRFLPAVGEVFNEYKHEPIGIVEDTNLQDEQIKEVARLGLIYMKEIFNEKEFLIRPAQVIVVKNKPQSSELEE